MKKDLTGLRKFIYNLDTAALEQSWMSFQEMIQGIYEDVSKITRGEYMSSIAYVTETINNCNTYEEK